MYVGLSVGYSFSFFCSFHVQNGPKAADFIMVSSDNLECDNLVPLLITSPLSFRML